eukprot:8565298-Pyramimonas_sp.AAC.1
MAAKDIVLLNVGLHHNTPETLHQEIHLFASWLTAHQKQALPYFIWKDTSPQHFPETKGGNYGFKMNVLSLKGHHRGCQNFAMSEMVQHDWRNNVSLPIIRKLGIPVVNTWRTVANLPHAHFGTTSQSRTMLDCVHFCPTAGVFELWWAHLYHVVLLRANLHNNNG